MWTSIYMGREFEERSISGIKVGEGELPKATVDNAAGYSRLEMTEVQNNKNNEPDDTSCGLEEEGQAIAPVVTSTNNTSSTAINSTSSPEATSSTNSIKKNSSGKVSAIV
jgi:hypothetical protein